MRAVFLEHNALTIRCESKFEEKHLEPIINALETGENKKFSVFAGSDDETGLGFLTIETEVPQEIGK